MLGVCTRIVPKARVRCIAQDCTKGRVRLWTRIAPRAELGYGLGLYQWSELGVWTKVAPRARVRCMDQDCSKGQSYVYGLGLYQRPELGVLPRIVPRAELGYGLGLHQGQS